MHLSVFIFGSSIVELKEKGEPIPAEAACPFTFALARLTTATF